MTPPLIFLWPLFLSLKCFNKKALLGFVFFLGSFLSACNEQNPQKNIPYSAQPYPNLITAGQPSKKNFVALSKKGIKTVINLRAYHEFSQFNEAKWVRSLGMKYIHIPIQDSNDLNEINAKRLDDALNNLKTPVLLHCGSSNRVGGLLAIRANLIKKIPIKQAIQFGQESGMTTTEKHVKLLLSSKIRHH
jgi:uncharacterized protein (TIGR01244 family)